MNTTVTLPNWLDAYIFKDLGGVFDAVGGPLAAIDWNSKEDQLRYLGTYLPKSAAESYCIFSDFFLQYAEKYETLNTLKILDVCCGCGGELIGFVEAVRDRLPKINKLIIFAVDGNEYAIRYCQAILGRLAIEIDVELATVIHKAYFADREQFDGFKTRNDFDFVISHKAMNEFYSKKVFGTDNPYTVFVNKFAQHLNERGVICLADITCQIPPNDEWATTIFKDGLKEVVGKSLYRLKPFKGDRSEDADDRTQFNMIHSGVRQACDKFVFDRVAPDKSYLMWRLLGKQDWENEDIPREDTELPW